ncbi:MAG: hypothetical protein E6K72_01310, partial [Candidatus Eisenbacteria bacterium]
MPDGAGGAIIAWQDDRPGGYGVCVQHLNALGMPALGWPAPGILLAGAYEPSMSADGARGAMLAWAISSVLNFRRIVNGDPFAAGTPSGATIVDALGSARSGGAREPVLPNDALKAPHNRLPIVLPDGAGGVLLGWLRLSITADKLMFQRLDRAGAAATGWVFVSPITYGEYDPSMCADDSAGAIFAWKGGYPEAIYAQRVRSDGSLAAGWASGGLVVCAAPGTHRATGIVPDGAGGAIIVWRDGRNGSFEQIFAQRVTHDGALAAGWPVGGRVICTYACDPGDQRSNGNYFERS